MKRHQAFSFSVALALSAAAAKRCRPPRCRSRALDPVEARNHVTGARGPAAVLFGVPTSAGATVRRPARRVLRRRPAVHIDADGLSTGPWAVAVRLSLDGGRFVAGSWQPSADGSGLVLSGERAVQFASELYGKAELRLAVVRPLSVPFLFTFTVTGAEPGLRGWPTGATGRPGRRSATPAAENLRPPVISVLSPLGGEAGRGGSDTALEPPHLISPTLERIRRRKGQGFSR